MYRLLIEFYWDGTDEEISYLYKIDGDDLSIGALEDLMYRYFDESGEALLDDFLEYLQEKKEWEYVELYDLCDNTLDARIYFGQRR